MQKNKAIPPGYQTVGEVAKKMGVTVRTLQYYDRMGLLVPSAESEGGRRLYTDQDIIRLHQILSLKQLGFSLDNIQNHLPRLDSPAQVADALEQQADALRAKLQSLTEALRETEALRAEVLQMQTVDFKKYADIIVNLQMKNEYYWLIKHFDEETLDHIRSRFDRESGLAMMETFNRLQAQAVSLQARGVAPESEAGLAFAQEFWRMIETFTGGDARLLERLTKFGDFTADDLPSREWKEKQRAANAFIEPALDAYFKKMRENPRQEASS